MIRNKDAVVYENKGDFRGVVLENILEMFSEKRDIGIISISLGRRDCSKLTSSSFSSKKSVKAITNYYQSRAKLGKIKIAIPNTIDVEANKFVHFLIERDIKDLENLKPIVKKIIKPLYLFLDDEVLLYAKLKKLKFKKEIGKKDRISEFINNLEKKHPEIKRAIVNSYLELY